MREIERERERERDRERERERERNVLFNDTLNTFYLQLYGVRHMVKDHSDSEKGNIGYFYQLTARVLLYAPSHRQDNTYHGLCYTSCGALDGVTVQFTCCWTVVLKTVVQIPSGQSCHNLTDFSSPKL